TAATNPFGEAAEVGWTPRSQMAQASPSAAGATTSFAYNPDGTVGVVELGAIVSYAYDPTNQLISENRTGTLAYNISYTYDPLGNRLTQGNAGAITNYAYNAANELTGIAPPTGAPTTITYDANGNMALENANGSLTTYTWDFE